MKKIKTLCGVLALLCVGMMPVSAQNVLKFNADKKFKIVQFTDVHWVPGDSASEEAAERMNEVLDVEKPDLVIYTGDLVFGKPAMPLIQGQVVTGHHWLSMSEFTDLITISQMTPGPIAVNSATFVGIKIAGIPGALAATFGCILPSCIIVTVIAKLYLKYRSMEVLQGVLGSLRPAVVAMIAAAGISILITAFWGSRDLIAVTGTKWSLVLIFAVCMILLRKVKMNPIWVMILAGVMKVGISLI